MTKIKPLQALIYNPEKIKDLSRVVCPPYDIISPQRQQYYHQLDPHNLIHVLLGKDIPGEDKYLRAAGYFQDWLKDKILIQEKNPAIYFYSHHYSLNGEKKVRLGLIGLLPLGDKLASAFGHEHTRLEPKEDRLRLLRQVKANLSPIFVLFSDKKRIIPYLEQSYLQGKKPFIDISDDEKNTHKLWRLDSADIIQAVQEKVSTENIFIADGHHRYEVACAYREEMCLQYANLSGEEPFNYLLAYFTSIESKGLTVFPIHRLVKLEQKVDLENFKQKIKEYFEIEELKDRVKFFFLMQKAGKSEHVLGSYAENKYLLMRLRNIKILDELIKDKPKEYRLLDVAILNHLILKKILGLDLEDKENISFTPEAEEVIARVAGNQRQMGFFLNPVPVQQITAVALSGNKMPPKSTYFYPKVLSGLVINKFNEGKS